MITFYVLLPVELEKAKPSGEPITLQALRNEFEQNEELNAYRFTDKRKMSLELGQMKEFEALLYEYKFGLSGDL